MPNIRYFLGGNTPAGFYSLYHQLSDADRLRALYIIKGGPGSGKSTLMRRVERHAQAVFRRPGLAGRADPAPIGGGAGGWDGAPGGGIVSTRGAKGKVKGRTFSLKGKSTKKKLLVAKLRFAWGFH